jgi:NAD(P)-dependent dehydrogenase (short-subunit alcohol dehydrogenase family)
MPSSAASKVWLVTGSSRGLGRDLVEALVAQGHRVAATARNPADVADLVAVSGGRAIALRLDVTKPDDARQAVAATREQLGGLDVVVNNAGYANVASAEEIAEDDFRAQVDTDFFGVVNVTRAALPLMRAQGAGHIIQVSPSAGAPLRPASRRTRRRSGLSAASRRWSRKRSRPSA